MDNLAHLLAAHRASEFGLIGSLFAVGLAGSIAHCAAMCGPFVLAQVPADGRSKGGSALMRGALVPYHLGRATTYTLLEPYNEEIVRACIRCRGARVDRRGDAGHQARGRLSPVGRLIQRKERRCSSCDKDRWRCPP